MEQTVGVWLTNIPSPLYYDITRMERAVAEMGEAGFNTLYPNVCSLGTTFHCSRFAPIEPALSELSPTLIPSVISRRRPIAATCG